MKNDDLLADVRIASPCRSSWEAMKGDERVRFCGECRLNVYNLSSLSRGEANELIRRSEGRLCVRLFRRTDGTVLTRDCPVGVRALARKVVGWTVASVALFAVLALGVLRADSGVVAEKWEAAVESVLRWLGLEKPAPPSEAVGLMFIPSHPSTPGHP